MSISLFDHALVRRPAETVVNGLRADDRGPPSFAAIAREHTAYVAALEACGLAVTVLPPLPEHPDSIFVEDPALVFTEGAILLRPGTPERVREADALAAALRERFDRVLTLTAGYADGGDVLVLPGRVLIGLSGRTDLAGAAALVGDLAMLGHAAEVVHTPPAVLHLKTACSLVDDETVLATADMAETGLFGGLRVIRVPEGEERGANVLRLNGRVLVGSGFPRTIDLLAGLGHDIIALDNEEVGKIDAGLTCMSLRWRAG